MAKELCEPDFESSLLVGQKRPASELPAFAARCFVRCSRDRLRDHRNGGGGTSLVEAGAETLLSDKRDIRTGSTSASTALLQYESDVPLRELIKKVGLAGTRRSYQLCLESIGKLGGLAARSMSDCDFERKPSLFLARHQQEIPELPEEFQLRQGMDIELEFYDAAAVRKRFPFSRSAALFSQDGAQVDPQRLTHGLLAAGQRAGLEVCDRTEMNRLEQTRRGVRITTKNGFVITAHKPAAHDTRRWFLDDALRRFPLRAPSHRRSAARWRSLRYGGKNPHITGLEGYPAW